MKKSFLLGLFIFVGCFDFSKSEERKEGEEQGDCRDGEDNDDDGNIDCEDAGCSDKPVCRAIEEETEEESWNDTAIEEEPDPYYVDNDGDGYSEYDGDCDDNDYYTYPGVADNESYWYECMTDKDGDGYGDESPASGVYSGTDCDDNSSSVYPNASEIPGDGVDQDCNGEDEPDPYYVDNDGDGYSEYDGDCDDNDNYTFPGAAYNDGEECMTDTDGDGYGDESPASGVYSGTDCDDNSSSVYPNASEIQGDGIDQDCDGEDQEEGCEVDVYTDEEGNSYTCDEMQIHVDSSYSCVLMEIFLGWDCSGCLCPFG